MNERIKDIAEKAGLRFTQLMSNPMVPVVDGKETDLEKFAELIVSECLDIVDIEVPGMIGVHAMKKISEHFGVQE